MAVGRWVYVAQRIASHLVHKRDALDNLLRVLSGIDIRVAWIGWGMRIIVWALRSVLDTVFSVVVLAERALSREMEMQADLVAVSLTGSDALIHALHKLGAADAAWDQAIGLSAGRYRRGQAVSDVFALQSRVLERARGVLADDHHGAAPRLPRVVATSTASSSSAWRTLPACGRATRRTASARTTPSASTCRAARRSPSLVALPGSRIDSPADDGVLVRFVRERGVSRRAKRPR